MNVVKAISDSFGKHNDVSCFAHTLNLVCENALTLEAVKDLVGKCRGIVVWMRGHVKASDLHKSQSNAGIPEGKMLKLVLDIKTRWNSMYYMLERFIKMVPYTGQVLVDYDDTPNISSKERQDVSEVLLILRPLEAMTFQISGEKYVTLSQVIPLIH